MPTAVRADASCGWPRRRGQYVPRLDAEERRVESGVLFNFVMIGNIADDDGDDLLLVSVNIDRSQAGEQLIHPGKKTF